MTSQQSLARDALRAALRVRVGFGATLWQPFDVFDLAQALGVEVRFTQISSMEGMFVRSAKSLILLSSGRPSGRVRFTCAHELAHHHFGHGTHVSELFNDDNPGSPTEEENLANFFASFLLMPKSSVERAFIDRKMSIGTCSPMEVFIVSSFLGVGYSTLVHHLFCGLQLITRKRFEVLAIETPKNIKARLLGFPYAGELFVVDRQWQGRPIDVHEGNLVVTPATAQYDSTVFSLHSASTTRLVLQARRPGISRLTDEEAGWFAFCRVSRKGFEGRSIFRHLEEANDDHP